MNKTNLLIDLGIFAAFLVASEPHLTGNTIHEWLGVSFAAAIIVHILLHWKWIVQVGSRYFKNLFHVSRLKFVVDILLFVSMTAIIFSGILISKSFLSTLGIQLDAGRSWKQIHSLASNLGLLLMAVHFALNWNWVVSMIKNYIVSPVVRLFSKKQSQLVSVPVKVIK